MTARLAYLIRVQVTPWNAKQIEDRAQAMLCDAHARRDDQDFYAAKGKIHQALEFRKKRIDSGEPGCSLKDLLEAMGVIS